MAGSSSRGRGGSGASVSTSSSSTSSTGRARCSSPAPARSSSPRRTSPSAVRRGAYFGFEDRYAVVGLERRGRARAGSRRGRRAGGRGRRIRQPQRHRLVAGHQGGEPPRGLRRHRPRPDPALARLRAASRPRRRARRSTSRSARTSAAPGCSLPTGGIEWRHTRQPVVLEDWPLHPSAGAERFTTLATLRGAGPHGALEQLGVDPGHKIDELRKVIDLPRRVPGSSRSRCSSGQAGPDVAGSSSTGGRSWKVRTVAATRGVSAVRAGSGGPSSPWRRACSPHGERLVQRPYDALPRLGQAGGRAGHGIHALDSSWRGPLRLPLARRRGGGGQPDRGRLRDAQPCCAGACRAPLRLGRRACPLPRRCGVG